MIQVKKTRTGIVLWMGLSLFGYFFLFPFPFDFRSIVTSENLPTNHKRTPATGGNKSVSIAWKRGKRLPLVYLLPWLHSRFSL